MRRLKFFTVGLTLAITAGVVSCSKDVKSKPNFIFKAAPSKDVVAKMAGKNISKSELFSGIESDIYEAEMKLYEIKMNRLQAMILQKFMDADPRKKGLNNDQFMDKYIANNLKISDAQINAFAKERKIPKEQLNAQLKERVRQFLLVNEKKAAVDRWLAKQTKNSPVEIYLKKPTRPVFDVKTDGAPFTGGADAKVTLVEFSDFQCPFCAKGATILSDLKKKYGKKIKVVYKNFPLPFHTHAKIAAEAGMCAFDQGTEQFWKMHDTMFGDQTKLDKENLKATAKKIGLNPEVFNKCLDSKKHTAKVSADMEDGKKVGVKSTPAFFVNGQLINGAQPIEVFSELIDQELAK